MTVSIPSTVLARFFGQLEFGWRAPGFGLIEEGNLIGHGLSAFGCDDTQSVLSGGEWSHPAQAGGREVLAVAVLYAGALAVDEEFGGVAVGVDLDHLLLAFGAPAYRPGMAVEVHHGRFGPIGLEDEVGLLLRHVAFDQAFLVDARDGIFNSQGSGEVLEDPLRRSGEPGQGFLGFQVPVEEVAGVGFGPVAVFRDASGAAGVEVGEAALVGAVTGGDLGEHFVGIFGVAAGVAVGSPLGVEEMLDALALGFEGLLVLGIGAAVPAGPDGGRVDVGDVAGKVAAANCGEARWVELMGEGVQLLQIGADGCAG